MCAAWKQNSINVSAISCKFHQWDKPTTHITLVSLRSILHTCLVFLHPLNLHINVIQHTINTFILLIIDYCKTRSNTFRLTILSVLRCCVCTLYNIDISSCISCWFLEWNKLFKNIWDEEKTIAKHRKNI